MQALEGYARQSGLEPDVPELVRVRASQINGCAFCIDMHTKDARAAGESEQRLYALAAIYFVLIYRLFRGKVRIEDDGY